MDSSKAFEAALWTAALVCIAITLAAGTRIVAWIVEGDTSGLWRASVGLILAASGGGIAATYLRRRNGRDQ